MDVQLVMMGMEPQSLMGMDPNKGLPLDSDDLLCSEELSDSDNESTHLMYKRTCRGEAARAHLENLLNNRKERMYGAQKKKFVKVNESLYGRLRSVFKRATDQL